jgi:hypothetical protein
MPIKLNVGASKKVSDERYSSRGASVNLEIELDSSLATDAPKLQERIRHLFNLVRQSLSDELNAGRNGHVQPASNGVKQPTSFSGNGPKQYGAARSATAKQVTALYAIAKERGFDLRDVLRDRYNLDRPEQFTIQQASELIDALRSNNE